VSLISPLPEQMRGYLLQVFRSVPAEEGGDPLGEYKRPGLPNVPAIIVGRSLPKNYSVVVAPPDLDPIPALEVIVDNFPDFSLPGGNFNAIALGKNWRIYLVFHDDRQFPEAAIRAIAQNFRIVSDIQSLAANDRRPYQYQLLITFKDRHPFHTLKLTR
jgi:hypothetical protein